MASKSTRPTSWAFRNVPVVTSERENSLSSGLLAIEKAVWPGSSERYDPPTPRWSTWSFVRIGA